MKTGADGRQKKVPCDSPCQGKSTGILFLSVTYKLRLTVEQRHGADCLQRPFQHRSRFRQQLLPGVMPAATQCLMLFQNPPKQVSVNCNVILRKRCSTIWRGDSSCDQELHALATT